MRSGSMPILLSVISIGVILAIMLARLAWSDPPPDGPTLLVGNPTRCVIDLLDAPRSASAVIISTSTPTEPGVSEPFAVSGPFRRYVVCELRDGDAVMGWSRKVDGEIESPSVFAKGVTRVAAAPDPATAGRIALEGWAGMDPIAGRTVLWVECLP